MMLRELRKQKKLTQAECAKYLGVPLRTYQNYETDAAKRTSIKYFRLRRQWNWQNPVRFRSIRLPSGRQFQDR